MDNRIAMAGTVLLEAYWASRQKDMLDLICPFVRYAVAKTTSIGQLVDTARVVSIIRSEFGYVDIPEAVIIKVINRDRDYYEKHNGKYYLLKSLDDQAEQLNHRRTECLSKIEIIGKSLFEYLQMHCKRNKIKSKEQGIDLLQTFFSLFALQIGLESLELESISYRNDEVNYHIARFIFEKKAY